MYKVESLGIENIRSYTTKATIQFSQDLTIITGANGSGKTTILECLHFILSDERGSVKNFVNHTVTSGTVGISCNLCKASNDSDESMPSTIARSEEWSVTRVEGEPQIKKTSRGKKTLTNQTLASFTNTSVGLIKYCLLCPNADQYWMFDTASKTEKPLDEIFDMKQYKNVAEAIRYTTKNNVDELAASTLAEVQLLRKRYLGTDKRNRECVDVAEKVEEGLKFFEQTSSVLETLSDLYSYVTKHTLLKEVVQQKGEETLPNTLKSIADIKPVYAYACGEVITSELCMLRPIPGVPDLSHADVFRTVENSFFDIVASTIDRLASDVAPVQLSECASVSEVETRVLQTCPAILERIRDSTQTLRKQNNDAASKDANDIMVQLKALAKSYLAFQSFLDSNFAFLHAFIRDYLKSVDKLPEDIRDQAENITTIFKALDSVSARFSARSVNALDLRDFFLEDSALRYVVSAGPDSVIDALKTLCVTLSNKLTFCRNGVGDELTKQKAFAQELKKAAASSRQLAQQLASYESTANLANAQKVVKTMQEVKHSIQDMESRRSESSRFLSALQENRSFVGSTQRGLKEILSPGADSAFAAEINALKDADTFLDETFSEALTVYLKHFSSNNQAPDLHSVLSYYSKKHDELYAHFGVMCKQANFPACMESSGVQLTQEFDRKTMGRAMKVILCDLHRFNYTYPHLTNPSDDRLTPDEIMDCLSSDTLSKMISNIKERAAHEGEIPHLLPSIHSDFAHFLLTSGADQRDRDAALGLFERFAAEVYGQKTSNARIEVYRTYEIILSFVQKFIGTYRADPALFPKYVGAVLNVSESLGEISLQKLKLLHTLRLSVSNDKCTNNVLSEFADAVQSELHKFCTVVESKALQLLSLQGYKDMGELVNSVFRSSADRFDITNTIKMMLDRFLQVMTSFSEVLYEYLNRLTVECDQMEEKSTESLAEINALEKGITESTTEYMKCLSLLQEELSCFQEEDPLFHQLMPLLARLRDSDVGSLVTEQDIEYSFQQMLTEVTGKIEVRRKEIDTEIRHLNEDKKRLQGELANSQLRQADLSNLVSALESARPVLLNDKKYEAFAKNLRFVFTNLPNRTVLANRYTTLLVYILEKQTIHYIEAAAGMMSGVRVLSAYLQRIDNCLGANTKTGMELCTEVQGIFQSASSNGDTSSDFEETLSFDATVLFSDFMDKMEAAKVFSFADLAVLGDFFDQSFFEKCKSEISTARDYLNQYKGEARVKTDTASIRDDLQRALNKYLESKSLEIAKSGVNAASDLIKSTLKRYMIDLMSSANGTLSELWRNTYNTSETEDCSRLSDIRLQFKPEDDSFDIQGTIGQVLSANDYTLSVTHSLRNCISSGQKLLVSLCVRIALAHTFKTNLPILALDEPTNFLDGENRNSLAEMIGNFICNTHDMQIIIITHNMDFRDKLITMCSGAKKYRTYNVEATPAGSIITPILSN